MVILQPRLQSIAFPAERPLCPPGCEADTLAVELGSDVRSKMEGDSTAMETGASEFISRAKATIGTEISPPVDLHRRLETSVPRMSALEADEVFPNL